MAVGSNPTTGTETNYDMIKLIELLSTDHYKERKSERLDIKNIILPKGANIPYNSSDLIEKLKQYIKHEVGTKLKNLEGLTPGQKKSNQYRVVRLYRPLIQVEKNTYPIELKVHSTKNGRLKETQGNLYVVIMSESSLITIFLSNVESDLERQSSSHLEERGITNYRIQVIGNEDTFNSVIDVKELMEGKSVGLSQAEVQEEDLPYKVRTDYRKGATLDHDQYGKQEIINTSSGVKGQPDQKGKLDWVEIESKPYVKGGKLMTTRRIPNIYAKAYWIDKEI